mgnify:CR=1 FL=1
MSGYIAPQQPIQPQPPLQPVYQEEKGLTVCGIVGVVFGALGFLLAITLMAGVRERLETSHIPDQFKGFPIGLFMAGLMSVAFMGFNGLV